MKTKLIIFDFDGVILDSLGLVIDIYKQFSDEFNIPDLKKNLDDPGFFKEFFELDWKRTLGKIGITSEEAVDKSVRIFREVSDSRKERIKIFDGVRETIEELSEEYELAIVSNNFSEVVLDHLNRLGLHNNFSLVLGCDHGKMKPSPDLILKCMKKLNHEPEETVFIGDMDGDIKAAKSARIKKVIGVTYGYHDKKRLKGADIIIGSPDKIIEAVK